MKLLEYIETNLAGFKPGNPHRFQKGNKFRFKPGHNTHGTESPTQKKILARLQASVATLEDVEQELGIPKSAISPCLWRLKRKGMVEKIPTCKWRAYGSGRESVQADV